MRIKRGVVKNRKHKKLLEQTKGYRLSYSKLYRRAKEASLHAGQYSLNHRRKRGSQFRRLWITRINAGLTESNISYKDFINNLKNSKIELNRKMLSELALNNKQVFEEIIKASN